VHRTSLLVLALLWLVPVLGALMTSLLPLSQIRDGWWNFSLLDVTYRNYVRAWDQGLSRYAVNSLLITGLSVLLTVSTGALAAYAYARTSFPLRRLTYFLVITGRVPGAV